MILKSNVVHKPWGYEVWISDGSIMPYALKNILFKAGNRSSLQVHEHKRETITVVSGHGELLYSTKRFPVEDYALGKVNAADWLPSIADCYSTVKLSKGVSFNVEPGIIHRMIAITDLETVEASTLELDDVIRLEDDANRPNGKIESEHV